MNPSSGFSFGSKTDRELAFQAMCDNGDSTADACASGLYALREAMVGLDWTCDGLKAAYTRAVYPAGYPLSPSVNCWEQDWGAMDEHASAVLTALYGIKASVEGSNSDITMYFVYPEHTDLTFDLYLAKDLEKLGLSFGFVLVVLWWMSSSLFLTLCGLLNIVISFPLGLFVWAVVLDEPGVTYLMYNGIFIILGIGCDDIFVFLDAFRQAHEQPPHISGSLETRFAWAYRRAATAMFTTSFTTCLAFAGCALSEIWDIRCFGVVNGFMVFFNFLLVITFFPAAMLLHEKYLLACAPWCTPQRIVFRCCKRAAPPAAADEGSGSAEGGANLNSNFLEEFYGGAYADFVLGHKRKIVALFGVLLLGSSALWTLKLEPATKPFTFFDDAHFYSQTLATMQTKFAYVSASGKIMLQLSFGLDP
jgi:hypothetical protein